MRRTNSAAWAMAITLAALVSVGAAPTGKGPVVHLSFNAAQGIVVPDESGNKNDGKVLNGGRGIEWAEGVDGKAIEFIGGDPAKRDMAACIEIPGIGKKCDFSKGVSILMRVKFTKLERSLTYELVSNAYGDRGKGFRFMVAWQRLCIRSGPGGYSQQPWGAFADKPELKLKTGVWYHVAGTYDGSVFRVYLDGKEVAASKEGLALTPGRDSIYVGSFVGGSAYGLNAVVDDLKIYDQALTAADVLAAVAPAKN